MVIQARTEEANAAIGTEGLTLEKGGQEVLALLDTLTNRHQDLLTGRGTEMFVMAVDEGTQRGVVTMTTRTTGGVVAVGVMEEEEDTKVEAVVALEGDRVLVSMTLCELANQNFNIS